MKTAIFNVVLEVWIAERFRSFHEEYGTTIPEDCSHKFLSGTFMKETRSLPVAT